MKMLPTMNQNGTPIWKILDMESPFEKSDPPLFLRKTRSRVRQGKLLRSVYGLCDAKMKI